MFGRVLNFEEIGQRSILKRFKIIFDHHRLLIHAEPNDETRIVHCFAQLRMPG